MKSVGRFEELPMRSLKYLSFSEFTCDECGKVSISFTALVGPLEVDLFLLNLLTFTELFPDLVDYLMSPWPVGGGSAGA